MVCCSVCFVSQMRFLRNPGEHRRSLSACVHPQPLHPPLKKLSFLLLGPAPLRGGLFPLFFPERQARPCHWCQGTTALQGCVVLGLATRRLPFGAARAPSGAAARGHRQRRAGPGSGLPPLATVCSSCLLGRFPVCTYSVCRPVAF